MHRFFATFCSFYLTLCWFAFCSVDPSPVGPLDSVFYSCSFLFLSFPFCIIPFRSWVCCGCVQGRGWTALLCFLHEYLFMVAHMVWCLFACLNWITALLLLCSFVVTLGVSFENVKNGHAALEMEIAVVVHSMKGPIGARRAGGVVE